MISKSDSILIVGGGSIGERHIGNLQSLGYSNIYVLRTRNLPFRLLDAKTVNQIFTWEEAESIKPKASFICTPTSLHLEQAIKSAEIGSHIFIEKPISHNLLNISKLKELVETKNLFCFIGYMMRYHPLIKQMKEIIEAKTYGNLLSFHSHWGEYLPDWHPWEDYREGYAARKELGGGAALTLSHDLDLMFWLSDSNLKRHYMISNKKSQLEVTAEAGADFLLELENGTTGHVHLNYFQRPSQRQTTLIFDTATLHFDYYLSSLEIKTKESIQKTEDPNFDRNQLFISELQDFFMKCDNFSIAESIRNIDHATMLVRICE